MHSGLPSLPDLTPRAPALPEDTLRGMDPLEGRGASRNRNPLVRRILAILLRFKWLVPIPIALGAAAGVYASRHVRPDYVARATLWVEPADPRNTGGPLQSGQMLQQQGWVDLLRSYSVLDSVVSSERLYLTHASRADAPVFRDFQLMDRFRPGEYRLEVSEDGRGLALNTREGAPVERAAVGSAIGGKVGFAWRPDAKHLRKSQVVEFTVVTPRDAAVKLGQRVVAAMPGENAKFLRLELKGDDPEKVTSTLNTLTARYVEVATELKRSRMKEVAGILSEQLAYSASNLAGEERSLQSFRVNTITLPTNEGSPVTPGLEATQDPVFQNFFGLQLERDQLRRDREAVQRALANTPEVLPTALEIVPSVQKTASLAQALQELTARRAELRTVSAQFTPLHPATQRAQGSVDSLQARTIPTLAGQLSSELSRREAALDRLIGSASTQLQGIPPRAIEEARRRRRVAIAEDLYKLLQRRHEEARLAAVTAMPDVRVLDRATVPYTPVSDTRIQMILIMTLGGLGIAVAGAFLFDRFNPKLSYPEQVTDRLGLPVLGAIPRLRAGTRKHAMAVAHAQEAFRGLRLSLVHASGTAGPMVLTVTSPQSGDGKSFVSANLAMTFAAQGHRTLLIDADLRRGHLHELLHCSRKPGLTDYLRGNAAIDEILQPTEHPRLAMIATGSRSSPGPELLATSGMVELLMQLRARFGVIIVDSPPMGACTDPLALATLTRDTLLVVRTDQTRTATLEMNLEMLDRLPVRVLGAVINDVSEEAGIYRAYSYVDGYEYAALPGESDANEQVLLQSG